MYTGKKPRDTADIIKQIARYHYVGAEQTFVYPSLATAVLCSGEVMR